MMASFVDLSEYLAYYGITDGDAIVRAEYDLAAACDRIRDYLGQTIDEVEDDVVTIHGSGTRALTLPELPATVTTITDDGTAVTDWTVDDYGLIWRTYSWCAGRPYVVTYTHGYAAADVPALLKVVAFKLARIEGLAGGVRQESAGPFSVTYETPDQVLTVLDRQVVKRVPVP
jgi:methyl coenzyme M reductase alpha subunit